MTLFACTFLSVFFVLLLHYEVPSAAACSWFQNRSDIMDFANFPLMKKLYFQIRFIVSVLSEVQFVTITQQEMMV